LPGASCYACWAAVVHGAETNTKYRASASGRIPQSVFATEGATGKDPFFPNSRRRIKQDDSGKKPPIRDFFQSSETNGHCRRRQTHRDDYNLTFAVGEEQEVKVEGGKVKIRRIGDSRKVRRDQHPKINPRRLN